MNIVDRLKDKFINPEEFYNRIMSEKYPLKYYDTGKYLKNLYSLYGSYDRELVLDSIKYFDMFKKNGFYFPNLDMKILKALSNYLHYPRTILGFYDQVFIQKNKFMLFEMLDNLRSKLFSSESNMPFSDAKLAIIFSVLILNKSKLLNIGYFTKRYALLNSFLNQLFITFWVNNDFSNNNELDLIVDNILLDENFIESLIMKGFDPDNLSYEEIEYITNLLYKNEYSIFHTKIIN